MPDHRHNLRDVGSSPGRRICGIIDLGFAINRYTVLNNATREGVRAASLSASQGEVDDVVNDSLTDLEGRVTVQVTCETPLGREGGREHGR